jgi:hypothetical protein
MTKRSLTVVLTGIFVLVAFPGMALGLYSYEGSDYSYDFGSYGSGWIANCDMESDGNGAYAHYKLIGSGDQHRLEDPNGSQPGCGYGGSYATYIYSHQTCEDRAFQPDPCGDTVYPRW